MPEWNHVVCERDWIERNTTVGPDGKVSVRLPHRHVDPGLLRCCFCGKYTFLGIFIRQNPTSAELLCQGFHEE